MRPSADALVESVLVLKTLGAPERRTLRSRRPRPIEEAEPEPVPTSRATVVRAAPFAAEYASNWVAGLRADADALEAEVSAAVAVLNRAVYAHRVATADPFIAEVSASRALAVRVGYGSGDEVAEGRFGEAYELPPSMRRRARRSMEAPEERFAALLSGRERALPAEELVLRARADLAAGRLQEAALQARVAIEALLAALPDSPDITTVSAHRDAVATAANTALRGPLPGAEAAALEEGVAAMEKALKRHRLRG